MKDLLETDQVNESWYGEIYLVKFNPKHQFYWLRDQSPDEVCLMVMFDSHNGEPETDMHCKCCPVAMTSTQIKFSVSYRVKGCAHVSLQSPDSTGDTPPRESIEVRAIVVNKISVH